MAKKNKGTFLIDNTIPEKQRQEIIDRVKDSISKVTKTDVAERTEVINKRKDFFEGRHHLWTNVVGQSMKQMEGHIQTVFNYVLKFSQKLHQALTNNPPKIKIKPWDESDEVEVLRAEALEEAIYQVLEDKDNQFFKLIFKRAGMNQIRDGDFMVECKVIEDENGKKIELSHSEDLLKVIVLWDDVAGSSYSGVAFKDLWTLTKIKRDFGYDAEPIADSKMNVQEKAGSHLNDQYGMFSQSSSTTPIPTGRNNLPKAEIVDYWGYEVIKNKVKVVNLIFINDECVQFVVSDYKRVPRFIGHSFISPGRPWSMSFIDPLIDPQIELNDRSGEEGDLVRVGAHMKFLVVNMSDFDPDSIKPGSGQVIFLEGENVDFRPLQMSISTFPSESYLNRVLDHMFNLGLPKIALSSGTAPYTGRVAAIQYQPIVDLVTDLRVEWERVMNDLIITIQEYFIDYFPEMNPIMTEHSIDPTTGQGVDGEIKVRKVEFDWENILPLSRSDKVVDAATLRDRGAISLDTMLEEAGFRNPSAEIKKLKQESKDPEMMVIRQQFQQYAPGVVKAELDASKVMQEQQAQQMEQQQLFNQPQATPKSTPPVLTPEQNTGRRGVLSGTGSPTGQTASLRGNVNQTTQNINAKAGV